MEKRYLHNYQPVSLTNIKDKAMERMIYAIEKLRISMHFKQDLGTSKKQPN
jgi:hypothetical protein